MWEKKPPLIILIIVLLLSSNSYVAQAQGTITNEFDANFGYQYNKSLGSFDDINFTPQNLTEYVYQNLTDTTAVDANTTYEWNDPITTLNDIYYNITVDIYQIDVFDDKDTFDAGEIYFSTSVNNYHERLPAEGSELSLNDGETAFVDFLIFNSTSTNLEVKIEVFDDDGVADDSLGSIFLQYDSPMNVTNSLNTDTADAKVYFNIIAIANNRPLTAGELLNGMKPLLNIDDEVGNDLPDNVFGRVLEGDDNGTDALVLQYLFYWPNERNLLGVTLHNYDFELVLIYLNISDGLSPYRLVFNNYFYTDDSDPSEDILILEKGAVEETIEYNTEITTDLNMLIGTSTNQTVRYKPLSAVENWQYATLQYTNASKMSMAGYTTFELTVETNYHNFDIGPGGDFIGYKYSVEALNHSIIQTLYAEIQTALEGGTHFVFSKTPVYSPFSFDLMQVFKAPYLISSYGQIIENIEMFDKANDAGLQLDQSLDIGFEVVFPAKVKYTHDAEINPGSTSSISIELEKSDEIILILTYDYSVHINFSYWFMQLDTFYNNTGEIEFNFDTGLLSPALSALGLDEFAYDDIFNFKDFISFDSLVITPKLLGTLMAGSISLNLWNVLEFVLGTAFPASKIIFKILGFFIENMDLTAEFFIESYVDTTVSSNDDLTLTASTIKFTEDAMVNTFDITLPDGTTAKQVQIDIADLAYKMDMGIDWSFNLGFKSPLNLIIPDFKWEIGTYPTYTAEIQKTNGGSFLIDVNQPSETTSNAADPSNAAVPLDLFFGVLGIVAIPVIIRKMR